MLTFGENGNLHLRLVFDYPGPRHREPIFLWSSDTSDQGVVTLNMQRDGNLVMYTADGRPVWSSRTARRRGASLKVQGDGNVVIYTPAGRPVWATHTDFEGRIRRNFRSMGRVYAARVCQECAETVRGSAVVGGLAGGAGGAPGALAGLVNGAITGYALDPECRRCLREAMNRVAAEMTRERAAAANKREWDRVNDTIRSSMAGEGRREMDRTVRDLERAERIGRTA